MAKKAEVTKPANTAVALTTQDVPTLLEQVISNINSLKGKLPNSEKISVDLPEFGNIYSITEVKELTRAIGMISFSEEAFVRGMNKIVAQYRASGIGEGMDDAAIIKALRIPSYDIEGVSTDRWYEELFKCTQIVSNKTQLDKLEKVKEELEKHLSEEAKLAKALQNCADIMNQ